MITSTPAATKLAAALTANPGHTTAELARLAGIGRSTAGKLLAAWHAEGHAFRGGTNRAPTWTSPASNAAALADGAVDLTQPEPEPTPAPEPVAEPAPVLAAAAPAEAAPEPAPRHLSVVRDVPATDTLPEVFGARYHAGLAAHGDHDGCAVCGRPITRRRGSQGAGQFIRMDAGIGQVITWDDPRTDDGGAFPIGTECAKAFPAAYVGTLDEHQPAPAEDQPTDRIQPAPAAAPAVPEGKLAKGGLRAIVAAWLAANPSTEITPARLGRELDRSPGAVHNALETLCTRGGAVRTSDKPKTYRMAGDA